MEPFKNYYEILKVENNASHQELRSAYKKLLLELHPDKQYKTTFDLNEQNRIRKNMLGDVYEAFRVLSDKISRREYDDNLNKLRLKRDQWEFCNNVCMKSDNVIQHKCRCGGVLEIDQTKADAFECESCNETFLIN